jgi:hypothetical protein
MRLRGEDLSSKAGNLFVYTKVLQISLTRRTAVVDARNFANTLLLLFRYICMCVYERLHQLPRNTISGSVTLPPASRGYEQ